MSRVRALWDKLFGHPLGDSDEMIREVAEARIAKANAEEANREASSRVEAAVSRLLDEYRQLRSEDVSRTMHGNPPAAY